MSQRRQTSTTTTIITTTRTTVADLFKKSAAASDSISLLKQAKSPNEQNILRVSSSAVLVNMASSNNGNNADGGGGNNNNNVNNNRGRAVNYFDNDQKVFSSMSPGEMSNVNVAVISGGRGEVASPLSGSDSTIQKSVQASSSSPLFSLAHFMDGSYEKLVIPLAGVTLLSAFLLVLIVNYFLHMRRNGFFKRGRQRSRLATRLAGESQKAASLPTSSSSDNNHSAPDKERLVGNKITGDPLDASATSSAPILLAMSSSDCGDPNMSSFELPPLPSPQLEYRPFIHNTGRSPSPPTPQQRPQLQLQLPPQHQQQQPVPSKLAVVVLSAQQQHYQQQQQRQNSTSSGTITPVSPAAVPLIPLTSPAVTAATTAASASSIATIASPKQADPRRTNAAVLSAHRPSTSSNQSRSNRGSSERILSVQESFDSAYEVRLYDELAIDPMSVVSRALSKRAPLLKGESLSDDTPPMTSKLGGNLMMKVPQSLMIVNSDSSGPFFSRQASMGGDLSPVEEQPVEHSHFAGMAANSAAMDSIAPHPLTPSSRPMNGEGKQHLHGHSIETSRPTIRFNTTSDAPSTSSFSSSSSPYTSSQPPLPPPKHQQNGNNKNSPTGEQQPKQKSLLSIFKEKRVTLLEHVKAMSPTKSEHPPQIDLTVAQPPQSSRQFSNNNGGAMAMTTRSSDLIQLHHASGSTPTTSPNIGGRHPQAMSTSLVNQPGGPVGSSLIAHSSSMNKVIANAPGQGVGRGASRGRSRGAPLGGGGGPSNNVNANMLMRMGGRAGDN